MSKTVSKKSLFVCLIISLVLIIAGAFVFGFLGFNGNATMDDYTSIEVSDSGYMAFDDNFRASLQDFCSAEIEKGGYDVAAVKYNQSASGAGSSISFRLSDSGEGLDEFVDALSIAIDSGVENAELAVVSVTYHNVQNEAYYDFIWRTAIAAAVAAVVLFIYAAIRFKVGMGFTALIAAVHDVVITLAVAALLRVPVGVAFIGVAAYSLLISAFMNLMVFGKMRRDFRSDERKNLPAREGIALAVADSRKTVFVTAILLAAAFVVLGVAGAVVGIELLWFMLTGLMAVIASTYSSLCFAPAIYACIKEKSDAKRAEKAKYNYASDKQKSKEAKGVPAQEVVSETK